MSNTQLELTIVYHMHMFLDDLDLNHVTHFNEI